MRDSIFTTALEYHKAGRSVIPSGGGKDGKAALIPWKSYQQRLSTEQELRAWRQQYQPEIWAMVTGSVSKVFVVDCDTADAITMMQDAGLEPHVRTPKGFHYYVKLPAEWGIQNQVRILPGVDIRGEKGYVNFTGSNGKASYEVYRLPTDDNLYNFEQLPRDLQRRLKPAKFKATSEKLLDQALDTAKVGNRNDTGFWLARQLRDAGITQVEAESVMRQYAGSVPQDGSEPYTEAEAIASLKQAYQYQKTPGQSWQSSKQGKVEQPGLDDIGNGERLAQQWGNVLRYLPEWGWLSWNGRQWIQNSKAVHLAAKWTARSIYNEAAQVSDRDTAKKIADHAYRSAYKTRRDAMIDAAKTEAPILARLEQFDSDPWLLNCQNGVLNLKTRDLQPHDPELYQTKITNANYDPNAECPRWLNFLNTIFQGDQQLIRFVQKAAGFSLTGLMPDRILFILYGSGANGKTTFISTIANIMGSYATDTPPETLTVRKQEQIPNDIAKLHNKRLVSTSEVAEGRALNEALIKKMTGRGKMSARFLHKEWFDFDPIFKLWIDTNHKPIIRETTPAIWDRIKLIPFEYRIPDEEQEEDFGEKLREEHDGILAWLVQGCQLWQQEGFREPQKVRQATQGYQAEMDTIQQFIDDCCVVNQRNWEINVKSSKLYNAYHDWCKQMGERILSSKAFSQRLIEKGFVRQRTMGGMYFYGIGLRA